VPKDAWTNQRTVELEHADRDYSTACLSAGRAPSGGRSGHRSG
jgi:hypothetical protein